MEPKLKLLIELGRNKLKTQLDEARGFVRTQVNQMQDRLDDLHVPPIDTRPAKASLSDLKDNIKEVFGSLQSGDFTGAGKGVFDMFKNNGATLAALGATAAGVAAVGLAGVKTYNHLSDVSKEIGNWQSTTAALFDATGEKADQITARIGAMTKATGKDYSELALASNNFYREFSDEGLTAYKSLELLRKGLVATNNLMDVDNVREYSAQLKQAGYNAEEAMAFVAGQVSAGTFSDKMVDAIKEGGLRIRKMTKATADAITALGLKPKKILNDLNSGGKTMKQTIAEITQAMGKAGVMTRQTATADIFGGPGEDLGERALLNIGKYNESLDDMLLKQGTAGQLLMQRLELEERIIEKQERFAPMLNEVNEKIEILKLRGKEWFYDMMGKGIEYLWQYRDEFKAVFNGGIDLLRNTADEFKLLMKVGVSSFALIKNEFVQLKNDVEYGIGGWKLEVQAFGEKAFGIFKNIGDAWNAIRNGDFRQGWAEFTADIPSYAEKQLDARKSAHDIQLSEYNKNQKDLFGQLGNLFNGKNKKTQIDNSWKDDNPYLETGMYAPGAGKNERQSDRSRSTASEDVNKITGQAQQVKNITINFDSYIKGDVITQNQQIKNMDERELTRWLNDNFKRLLQSLELSYA